MKTDRTDWVRAEAGPWRQDPRSSEAGGLSPAGCGRRMIRVRAALPPGAARRLWEYVCGPDAAAPRGGDQS
jgi:hypothetical protein